MIIYRWSTGVTSSAGGGVTGTWTDIGNTEVVPSVPIPAGSTNFATNIAFNGANLQAIELLSDQNLTLYVNAPSGGSPFTTINLKAGIPYTWSNSAGQIANPLNVNVTQIYATGTPAANLSGRILTT